MGGWGRAALHRNRPLCQKPFWLASHHITLCNISQTLIEIFLQAVILLFKIFPGYQAFILSIFAGYQERDLPHVAEGGGGGEGDGAEVQGGAEVNTKAKK